MSDESRRVLWEGARVEFRRLQTDAETNIAMIERQPHGVPTALVATSNHLLQRMQIQVRAMGDLCTPERAQWQQQTQRSALIVDDLEKSLGRAMKTIKRRDEREDLMRRVHRDISDNENSEWNSLHAEQDSLSNASREVSAAIEIAATTNERLRQQRGIFMNAGANLATMIDKFPVVNQMLNKIRAKKQREVIVIGGVVGVCLFLVWLFW